MTVITVHRAQTFSIAALAVLFVVQTARSQDHFASEWWPTAQTADSVIPAFQYARNMAVTSCIPGHAAAVRTFMLGTRRFLITTESAAQGFVLFEIDSTNTPVRFGMIGISPGFWTRDAEVADYGNDSTRLYIAESTLASQPQFRVSRIASILLTEDNLLAIQKNEWYQNFARDVTYHTLLSIGNVEMLHCFDGRLFVASNTSTLFYYDVATSSQFDPGAIILNPALPTHFSGTAKVHEVKGFHADDGSRWIGVGLVRSGMCLMHYDSTWQLTDTLFQIYDFDRTTFPDTIINPYKVVYDSVFDAVGAERNHKWDYRICHSVLPYDGASSHHVLTVDEYTNCAGYQDSSGNWMAAPWEGIDFYPPNDDTLTWGDGYYNHIKLTNDSSKVPVACVHGEDTLRQRLNYLHRTRPRYEGRDPNKFQGAFVRIWDRDAIPNNTLSANGGGLLENAYDVQEGDGHPEGYVGLHAIPDTAVVPCGLHEPIIAGNRLYLAGYNAGARVLEIDGPDLALRGYARTEEYLSDSIDSPNFYARPDLPMYAKGIYRLIPDTGRDDILYGSDINHGTWVLRFYDSTLTDTIRHLPMQPCVEIGTVESAHPRTFTIREDVIVPTGSRLCLLGNTTFSFDSARVVRVFGRLAVHAATFAHAGADSEATIVCAGGGVVDIGGEEEVVTGFCTLRVDSGGTATIRKGTTLLADSGSVFDVAGALYIESSSYSTYNRIRCRAGGRVIIEDSAVVQNLHTVEVDSGGTLILGGSARVRMATEGILLVRGGLEACLPDTAYAVIEKYMPGNTWEGVTFDHAAGAGAMTNVRVHDAASGVTVDESSPVLRFCELSENIIGLTITGGFPTVVQNDISNNSSVGLLGYDLAYGSFDSNTVRYNRYYGLRLFHCSNYWRSNKIDANDNYGVFCEDGTTTVFNPTAIDSTGGSVTDTTQGNGLRDNYDGIHMEGLCSAGFEGDNSVHGNGRYDVILLGSSIVMGSFNYPPDTSMVVFLDPYGSPVFSWDYPVPDEPVLYKGAASAGTPAGGNPQIVAALLAASVLQRSGSYAAAIDTLRRSLRAAADRSDVERCLLQWAFTLDYAQHINPTRDPVSQQPEQAWALYRDTLLAMRASTRPAWLRATATEFLAAERLRAHEDAAALALYEELSALTGADTLLAQRAHKALVFLHHRRLGDYRAAYSVYERIEQRFPGTDAVIFAKIDLGLPLTEDDRQAMTRLPKQDPQPGNATVGDDGFLLDPVYPNPARSTAVVGYELRGDASVSVTVYDARGRMAAMSMTRIVQSAGRHAYAIDVSSFPAGVYRCRVAVRESGTGDLVVREQNMVVVR